MKETLPANAGEFAERYPESWDAFTALGKAISEQGPLDGRSRRLVKIALAMAVGSEGATHSHVRRAVAEGISAEEIRHVALLGVTTLGFPQAVAAMSWADDELSGGS